jgi:UPF0755 protein
MTAWQVGLLLEREGLVRSAAFFWLAARLSPSGARIQAGFHDVDGGASTRSVLRSLAKAKDLTRSATIPEGLTVREVADLLAREVGVDPVRFVAACADPGLCRELGVPGGSLEGYLFPDTYRMPPRAEAGWVARLMVGQFRKVFDGAMRVRAQTLGMSVHQAVTLASIVEREARIDAERPLISGVFHRRLKMGMRLESDPTTEYALGVRKPRLYLADLAVDSPYNTYRVGGLPPGPIANPGRASLRAALYPVDAGHLFFVARGDGTHAFSRTKQEHDRARARIRKEKTANPLTSADRRKPPPPPPGRG